MAINAPLMSSFQSSILSPPVKNELNPPWLATKPKANAQKTNIDKLRRLIEQSEDVLAFARNELGEVQLLASPNLKHEKWTIMQDAHEMFNEYLQAREPNSDRTMTDSFGHPVKAGNQSKKTVQDTHPENNGLGGSISYMAQRPAKRQRSGITTTQAPGLPATIPMRVARERRPRRTSINDAPAAQIQVNDRDKLEQWFREAFLTMQQVACRLVAKVWIKKIHPKKQSTHPYNGGIPRDQPPDSNRTRPPYWPTSVIHREPDHIGRDDRVNLLVHLIMNTPQPILLNPADPDNQQMVTARDLADCLEEKKAELKEIPWEIIQNVIHTREIMEQYEAGEIDGDSLVFLSDYSARSTLVQNDSESDSGMAEASTNTADSDLSLEDDDPEERETTPASSLHSPGEYARIEESQFASRVRRTTMNDSAPGRGTGGQRSRSSLSMNQTYPAMIPRAVPEIPAEMAMAMGKFDCHIDAGIQDAMVHDARRTMSQSHIPTQMMIGVGPQMSPHLPIAANPFDRDLNGVTHEVVADNHRHHDLMRGMSHRMHHQDGVNYQAWMGMLSDMSPGSADDMYSAHPHLNVQSTGIQHGYYDQSPTELVGTIQSGLPLMDPAASYQDVNQRYQRNLPVRIINDSQASLMSPTNHDLGMPHSQYYNM